MDRIDIHVEVPRAEHEKLTDRREGERSADVAQRRWEKVCRKDYEIVVVTVSGMNRYFRFYNHERLHQTLDYQTPARVYGAA